MLDRQPHMRERFGPSMHLHASVPLSTFRPLQLRLLGPTPLGDERCRTNVRHRHRWRGRDRAGAGSLRRHEQRRQARVDNALSDDGHADVHLHRGPHLLVIPLAQDTVALGGVELLLSHPAAVLKPQARVMSAGISISERAEGLSITMKTVHECGRRRAVEHGTFFLVLALRLLLLRKGLLKGRRRCSDDTGRAVHGHWRVVGLTLSPTGPATVDACGRSE